MKFSRNASASWKGSGKDGKGSITTESKVLDQTPYSFRTRFEEPEGTNPEELIGAAHAGCFTMQLSFLLSEADFVPDSLTTDCKITFADGEVTHSDLELEAKVPGITDDKFQEIAKKAKEICPLSKLLNTEITLKATLKG